ncbi:unnamed protein product [Lactuca saligna]|uniref:Uncharacterized protein n=1 Tax=Lactuca saligna TaxID=75948 RepID=A0AA35Z721_LACSI|nr:unnamed protein product [Lactuca saligna]
MYQSRKFSQQKIKDADEKYLNDFSNGSTSSKESNISVNVWKLVSKVKLVEKQTETMKMAADVEINFLDNQISELSKHSDFPSSTLVAIIDQLQSSSSENGESMLNNQVMEEHLPLNSNVEGEHSFAGENRRIDDNVEGEQHDNETVEGEQNMSTNNHDEICHDLYDNVSVTVSENDELLEDASLDFDLAYPPMDKRLFVAYYHDESYWFMFAVLGSGVLLAKPDEGSSKKYHRSKKGDKSTAEQTVNEPVVKKSSKKQPEVMVQVSKDVTKAFETKVVEPVIEIVPSKSSVLKRLKMKARGSRKSLERFLSFSPSVTCKPHVTRKGVIIREVQAPVSPSSKKRIATDMAKKISMKIKRRKLVLQKTSVIPPEVSLTKSSHEEVRISDIITHVSDTDVNVTMGEGDSTKQPPMITQGIIETSSVNTLVSVPPFIIPTIPVSSSPTFDHIINQPITSLFSSQSTDPLKSVGDTETDDGGFGGTFDDLEFDPEEEDTPNHMLMFGKHVTAGFYQQFKILNKKLNSILQSQADVGGRNFVSSIEVDVMLKAQEARLLNNFTGLFQDSESRIHEKVDFNDKNNELRVKSQSSTFNEELKDLKHVSKQRHVLFVQDVKKVREDVNLKIQEVCEDMSKEIAIVQRDYASLNQNMDIIAEAVTNFVKLYEALCPHIAQMATHEVKSLNEITTLLNDLKALISKPGSSPLTKPEFLSQKFLLFE